MGAFSIHDTATAVEGLYGMARIAALRAVSLPKKATEEQLKKAMAGYEYQAAYDKEVGKLVSGYFRKVARHRGETSKYLPHQGARECARRHRQMEKLSWGR